MPGFDGRGPKGLGAMTGGGLGYCVLKESGPARDQITGYAGLAGRPVSSGPDLGLEETSSGRRAVVRGTPPTVVARGCRKRNRRKLRV